MDTQKFDLSVWEQPKVFLILSSSKVKVRTLSSIFLRLVGFGSFNSLKASQGHH